MDETEHVLLSRRNGHALAEAMGETGEFRLTRMFIKLFNLSLTLFQCVVFTLGCTLTFVLSKSILQS